MAVNYQTVSERDLARGIDARSTENRIAEGYAEDLTNVDTNSNGYLSKRPGYQGYYGYLPIRISSVEHSGTDIIFTFDGSINTINLTSTPIVVYGRLSATQSGDWSTTNNAEYYILFTADVRKTLTAPSGTVEITESGHGFDSNTLFSEVVISDSATEFDNTYIYPDAIQISDADPHDVDVDYTVPSTTKAFVYFSDKTAVAGTTYTRTDTVATVGASFDFEDGDVNTGTNIIGEVAHGLLTGHKVQLTTSGTLPAGLALSTYYYVIRVDADNFKLASTIANAAAGTAVDITAAAGGGTHTLTTYSFVAATTAATHGLTNFNILTQSYYLNGSSEWEKVTPHEVQVNATTGLVAIEYLNSGSSASFKSIINAAPVDNITTGAKGTGSQSFTISTDEPFNFLSLYYLSSGILYQVLPDSIVFDDSADTLTVGFTNGTGATETYFIYHEAAELTSSSVTVTDNSGTSATYTDTDPQLTLWGVGHQEIYKTDTFQEGHVTHIDSYRSDLEERLVAGLGGVLYSAQTRSEAGSDYLIPSSTVNIENRVGSDVYLAPLFDTTGSAVNRTRGLITDASITSNLATVTAVSYVSSGVADYTLSFTSKSGTIGTAIDTGDYLTITQMGHSCWNGTFQISSVQSESTTAAVIRVANSSALLADYNETGANGRAGVFTDKITLSATTAFAANDTVSSEVFGDATPTVKSTTGTTLYVSGITMEYLLPTGLSLFGTRTSSTIPLVSITNFVVGDMCTLTGYDRQVRITSISTANTTVTVDESLEFGDGTTPDTLAVIGRWLPIEVPTSADNLPETTYFKHFSTADYHKQSTVRSTMVADTLFCTNYYDEILKFDGTNIYQAGLFRWQPQLFAQLDTTTGSITQSLITGTVAAVADNKFTIGIGEQAQFQPGDTIYHSQNAATYTVQSTSDDSTVGFVFVVGTISGSASGTIRKANRMRYYFRLNAIDANQNIVASAATGASDFYFDLTAAGQIHIRAVGMPAWGMYDYDRLELEVYRTVSDTQAPFFRARSVDVDFNQGGGYIDIVDSTNDSDLQDLDEVTTALVGSELGTAWEQPLRAKYITTANNSLILANIKDYPELDITLKKTATATSVSASDLSGKIFCFRKDSADTSTTTDMINRVRYEFVNSGAVTIMGSSSFTFVDGDVNTGADTVTEASHGFVTGNRVQLTSTGTLPAGLSLATDYYIIRDDANTIRFATSLANAVAGTDVDITAAAGGGTHTVTPFTNIANSSGTAFVVSAASHGLVAGNWVYLYHNTAGSENHLQYAGWWQIASVTTHTFTIDYTHSSGYTPGSADVDRYVGATAKIDVPVWLGTDGNYNQVGGNTIDEFTAMLRMANAVNASMRMTDTSNATYASFVPWMTAAAGSEYGIGRLVIRQPKVSSTTMEVLLPAAITTANIFVQNILRAASAQVSASTRVFPSRMIISYPNYPEIFDNPFGPVTASDYVVEVNSADGQQITGVIPFFGESTFGQGQAESVVVIFKTNSVYLFDLNTKQLHKLQSRGLGCTAPYSIATTKDGIMFANEAGVFKLNHNQSITYAGQFIERIWRDTVNIDQLSIMTGHHYGTGSKYKLSVPSGSDEENSLVLVYDHQREGRDQEYGAWTKYDNHPATGWANLADDAFFATTDGQVFSIRQVGDSSDYRDDASAISMTILGRAMDFGAAGLRKIVNGVTSHFQLRRSDMDGTTMYSSPDLAGVFTSAGTFTFTRTNSVKTVSAVSSLPQRRAQFFQLKYVNSTINEDVVLAGIDYEVAGLSSKGLPERGETT